MPGYSSPLDQINARTTGVNPQFTNDNGTASASSPFLSSALSSGDSLTNLSNHGQQAGWGSVGKNIANVDQQESNNQAQIWANHQAQLNNDAAQKRLQNLVAQAEKQGNAAQAKAYQQEQLALQKIREAGAQYNKNSPAYSGGSYNYGGGSAQGTGAAGSARGVSAEGQNQLSTARADGYNLSSSNYDRTYHYNNQYSAMRNQALSDSYSWLGTHYVLDGETKQVGVDCSGLVQSVYSKLGYSIPLHSAEHEKDTIPGVRTSFSNLQPGDLVCWKDGSHIAVYAGNGEIIEAANTRVGTVRRPLWDSPSNVVGIHLTFADENRAQGQGKR